MLKKEIIDNMQHIVDNCMGDSEAACVATCPMHTDVKTYVRLIKEENGKEAIKVIRDKLFIPGTLGRICAHPCEKECKWNEGKSPMAIASLKRYAADNFDKEEDWDLETKPSNGKKVAVIGAGPSGLQAALDLRKEGCDVTVFEKLPVRGGMMAVGIPEYRLPRNVLEKEITYLDKLGVEFKLNCEIGKDVKFDELEENFDSIVIAVGKHMGRVDRSLANWDADGIFSAAGYLKEAALNRNVEKAGKKVLVVGGGDVAMDCCRVSKRIEGVEEVFSICLEDSFDTMASSNHEIKGALDEGVKFNHAQAIKDIKVDENGRVVGVTLKKCLSMFNEEGMFAPSFDESVTKDLEVDTIVFAIGQGVDAGFIEGKLEQARNTSFVCDAQTLQSTQNEKIFFAGDASGHSVIVIQAMATGRRAAQSVMRYLNKESLTEGRKLEDTWGFKTKLDMPTDWSKIGGLREDMGELDPETRIKGFDEVALGYTREEALRESDRCRQCECRLCMKECIMLGEYTECPKQLFTEYLEKGYENMDKMIAYSCNQCDQCTLVCPNEFNIKENFIAMKEEFAKENNGKAVLKELDFCAEQQEKESSEEYSITVKALEREEKSAEEIKEEVKEEIQKEEIKKEEPIVEEVKEKVEEVKEEGAKGDTEVKKEAKKTKYLYVPGCTVPAYTPEGSNAVLNHLRETLGAENVGAVLQCCGKVSLFVGEKERYLDINKKVVDVFDEVGAEVIVTVCPSCYKVYSDTVKNQKVISYWDLIRNEIGMPKEAKDKGVNSDVVFNIHDSCVTRNVTSHHESVRWMLDQMGYKWSEIEHNGKNTRCCGVGGLACSANPKLYEKIYTRRKNDFHSDSILTYCGSCRGTMETAGLDSVHILDLMFGPTHMKADKKFRGYKNEEEMWKNRLNTKIKFGEQNK